MRLEDMPLIGTLYRGKGPRGTRFEGELYDLMNEVDTLYSTVRAVAADGREKEARELLEESYSKLKLKPALNRLRVFLRRVRKRMAAIHKDGEMTPEEKRLALDELTRRKNEAVKRYHREIRDYLGKEE